MNEETQNQPQTGPGRRRLYRSVANRHIAGVCGGVAEYFNIDPIVVRLIWFLSIFAHGIGLFAYIAAWIIIPESREPVVVSPQTKSQSGQYLLGGILVALGIIFLADKFDFYFIVPWRWHYVLPYWFNWGVLFSILIILLGIMLIFRGGDTKPSGMTTTPPSTTTIPETAGPYPGGEAKMSDKRLMRASDERMIGGVCGGLAKYLNIDPSFVRIGFVIITLFSGMIIGIVTYVVMMIVIPEESPSVKNPETQTGNV
ncbi:MAG: PspC domain-containing protein [candidate division KSB1 bacterium]|nr:PspC domain-containing protein [candidate division KSB1 bacterium]MDZ7301860.1 PspC domain-containing protein [candidate division KSB1 bacterium]MDZ7310243.1 PspC domain-containing protein [candidate division KSB1 bacterium]